MGWRGSVGYGKGHRELLLLPSWNTSLCGSFMASVSFEIYLPVSLGSRTYVVTYSSASLSASCAFACVRSA